MGGLWLDTEMTTNDISRLRWQNKKSPERGGGGIYEILLRFNASKSVNLQ